jgi:hypothetical protein
MNFAHNQAILRENSVCFGYGKFSNERKAPKGRPPKSRPARQKLPAMPVHELPQGAKGAAMKQRQLKKDLKSRRMAAKFESVAVAGHAAALSVESLRQGLEAFAAMVDQIPEHPSYRAARKARAAK